MLVRERLASGRWTPPWLTYQHVNRYEWARSLVQGRVLDAACGNAYGSAVLRGSSDYVVPLDIAADALVDTSPAHRSLPLVQGDTTRLPFADRAFDAFGSFETVEHVMDDEAYVREARRVLRPGGVFLCSTPNRLVVNPGKTLRDRPFNPFHLREYSAAELTSLLKRTFDRVDLLGQRAYHQRYVRLLGMIGRRWSTGGVRLHQIRKVLTLPFDAPRRHLPQVIANGDEPEVLVAVCR